MAESVEITQTASSTADRTLVSPKRSVTQTSEGFIPDMSDDARRQVIDPFAGRYIEPSKRHSQWRSDVFYG